jgi:exodeoxyribonuclease III
MQIISWNVNSIRARLPRVTALLAYYRPDLACLQEIKTTTEEFPAGDQAARPLRWAR